MTGRHKKDAKLLAKRGRRMESRPIKRLQARWYDKGIINQERAEILKWLV